MTDHASRPAAPLERPALPQGAKPGTIILSTLK